MAQGCSLASAFSDLARFSHDLNTFLTDVVNFADAAISDVAASGRVSSKRISAPMVSEIAPRSQAAVPMVSASAPEAAETRVSSKRTSAPMVPAAAAEIEALEN